MSPVPPAAVTADGAPFALPETATDRLRPGNSLPGRQSGAAAGDAAPQVDLLLALAGLLAGPGLALPSSQPGAPAAVPSHMPGPPPVPAIATAWIGNVALDGAASDLPVRLEVGVNGRGAEIELATPVSAVRAAWADTMPRLCSAARDAGLAIVGVAVVAQPVARRPAVRRVAHAAAARSHA